jgi:hypothetical protein
MKTIREHWKLAIVSLPCWIVLWALVYLALTGRVTNNTYSINPTPMQNQAFGPDGFYVPMPPRPVDATPNGNL